MLEIYKDFELITMDPTYSVLYWRRRFSRYGEFSLRTFFTPEKFKQFEKGNIIYKRNVDEACMIEGRSVIEDINGDLMLIVYGNSLSKILDRRIATLEGKYMLKQVLDNIINNNFLSGAGSRRMINNMRLLPYSLPSINIDADYKQKNAYDTIRNLLEENNIGLKMFYNIPDKTFDLIFYEPVDADTVLSREFASVTQQDYTDNDETYKNVAYIGDSFIHNDNLHTGLGRREIAISKPSDASENLTQLAIDTLNDYQATRILSSTINILGKQFEYLEDWDIGSIVLSENKTLDYSEREIITEITEVYDEKGLNLEVNIGNYKDRRTRLT